jgi:hypothetical protein
VNGAEIDVLTVYGIAIYPFRKIINRILLSQIPIGYLFLIHLGVGVYTSIYI